MSKKPNATAAAVRAALYDPTPFTGRRDGEELCTPSERAAGGELKGYSVLEDLRAVVTPLLHLNLNGRCHRAIERAFADPSIRRLERLERLLDAEANRTDLAPGAGRSLREARDALVYHRAELGCSTAQAVVAARAFASATLLIEGGQDLDRAMILLRHAIFRAEEAQYVGTHPHPGPIYPHVESRAIQAEAWMKAWTVIRSAISMIEDEDAVLRGGAGQQATVEGGDFDFGLPDPAPTPARTVREILTEAKAATPALSLVVFPEMTHLPEPSKSIRDRGDSPRALAEPWAGKPMPLTPASDPAAFAAALRARFPWAAEAIEAYAADLVGAPYARLSPRILVGPAGCGKTAFARAVLEAAGLDVTVYGCAGQMDGGSWAGTSRQWGSWRPSVPAQACLRMGKASHGIIVDEVEKAGDSRRWGRLDETLLPFLERASTARAIHDPAFECALDLSPVSYVLTANSLDGLAGPLRDRCQVLQWPAPRPEDLPLVAAAILDELRRERGLDDVWCPSLSGDELDALTAWRGGSLRPLRRMVEAVLASRETFAPRH